MAGALVFSYSLLVFSFDEELTPKTYTGFANRIG
jgi:hypothetical protein